jgi:hypothetical protein
MSRTNSRRGALVVAVVVVSSAVLATGVVAGHFQSVDPSAFHQALATAEITQVAEVQTDDGSPGHGVFAQLTQAGHLCVFEAPSATSRAHGGACNSVDDPLNGSALSATLSYDGGPAIGDVTSATLFGLTTPGVVRARVLMSDGSSREVKLRKAKVGSDEFQAFGYRFKKGDLKRGIGPTAIVALDANGVELARQPTGIVG